MCFGTCLGVPFACTFCNSFPMGALFYNCYIESRNNEKFHVKANSDSTYEIEFDDNKTLMANTEARNFFENIEKEVDIGKDKKEYIVSFDFKTQLREFSLDHKEATKLANYLKSTIDTHIDYSKQLVEDSKKWIKK